MTHKKPSLFITCLILSACGGKYNETIEEGGQPTLETGSTSSDLSTGHTYIQRVYPGTSFTDTYERHYESIDTVIYQSTRFSIWDLKTWHSNIFDPWSCAQTPPGDTYHLYEGDSRNPNSWTYLGGGLLCYGSWSARKHRIIFLNRYTRIKLEFADHNGFPGAAKVKITSR